MAIAKFCAAHWATMAHEEEAPYPAEGEVCDFCGKPAARAAGHEPAPVPRGQLSDVDRAALDVVVEPRTLPSLRPSKAPPKV